MADVTPMVEPPPPSLSVEESAALARRRRARNIAVMLALICVAALFYAISIVKLAHHDLGAS